ncbi:MAG: hypothetical protein BGO66_21235 [Alicycliphilus sp. 69-12]|nr:MAG: hypothetical protein BGO66_21235 [Alicycliphilus sp. 69-12]
MVLVTRTVTVHDDSVDAAGRLDTVPPESVTLLSPGKACNAPAHMVCASGLAASTRPAGRVSVKAIPVSGLTVRLNTVMVSSEV